MSPFEASFPAMQQVVLNRLYPKRTEAEDLKIKKDLHHLNVGDHVLITVDKKNFEKSSLPKWTREVFVIASREIRKNRAVFRLKDLQGEDVLGAYLAEHVQKVHDADRERIIEKIVEKQRGDGKVKVKYMGWPTKFNEWLPAEEVRQRTSAYDQD